jgi:hypothetical protein
MVARLAQKPHPGECCKWLNFRIHNVRIFVAHKLFVGSDSRTLWTLGIQQLAALARMRFLGKHTQSTGGTLESGVSPERLMIGNYPPECAVLLRHGFASKSRLLKTVHPSRENIFVLEKDSYGPAPN